MHRILRARLLASALVLGAAPFIAASQPANAQASVEVSFNIFHDRLSAYGTWTHHARYGDVWRPSGVEADFHPYSRGHWVNTEDGFTWVSDYQWGDVPFHYGRWVFDDGAWLWVPGYVWAPAWVTWRSDSEHTGWAPMPPDDRFLGGDETSFDVDPVAFYGPRFDAGNFFIFVGTNHIAEPNFRAYIIQRPLVVNIFTRTRNITRISIVNDRVVNRSVDVRVVERLSRRRIPTLTVRAVLRPGAIITNVHVGREIDVRERQQHPRETPPGNNDHGQNGHGPSGNDNNGHNDNGHNDNGMNGKTPSDDQNGKDKGDQNGHGGNNNDNHGGPSDKDNAMGGGHPDTNGGANNPDANGNTPPDQTPPKHHKDDATPATPSSTPTDNNVNNMGPQDQTPPKRHKKPDTSDQTMQTNGPNTPADNGGAMGGSDQTPPKHHKDNGGTPPDQGTPPAHANNAMTPAPQGSGASSGPRTLNTPATNTPATQSGDQTDKPKKKDKNKTDDKQDNSSQ